MIQNEFPPAFPLKHQQKDLRCVSGDLPPLPVPLLADLRHRHWRQHALLQPKRPTATLLVLPTRGTPSHRPASCRLALALGDAVAQPLPLAAAANELYKRVGARERNRHGPTGLCYKPQSSDYCGAF
jgi:3-hydroxyisobutyrate dehydrogenase-like beta-hydroxyacid dehydrogenase